MLSVVQKGSARRGVAAVCSVVTTIAAFAAASTPQTALAVGTTESDFGGSGLTAVSTSLNTTGANPIGTVNFEGGKHCVAAINLQTKVIAVSEVTAVAKPRLSPVFTSEGRELVGEEPVFRPQVADPAGLIERTAPNNDAYVTYRLLPHPRVFTSHTFATARHRNAAGVDEALYLEIPEGNSYTDRMVRLHYREFTRAVDAMASHGNELDQQVAALNLGAAPLSIMTAFVGGTMQSKSLASLSNYCAMGGILGFGGYETYHNYAVARDGAARHFQALQFFIRSDPDRYRGFGPASRR